MLEIFQIGKRTWVWSSGKTSRQNWPEEIEYQPLDFMPMGLAALDSHPT